VQTSHLSDHPKADDNEKKRINSDEKNDPRKRGGVAYAIPCPSSAVGRSKEIGRVLHL